MSKLTTDLNKKIESLESSVTEKQLAYQKIDEMLFEKDSDDPSLIASFIKAKKELNEAVESHISFFKSISSADDSN
jgi:hypothetical protein